MTKFLNISKDNTLGGNSPSDILVVSQKAIKEYIDNNSGTTDIDDKSITTNSSDELQTVGVIDQNDTTTAIKTWSGTKAQYDVLVNNNAIDSNTLYNITDDELQTNFADINLSNLSTTGQAIIDSKANINLSNLSTSAQAILDNKVDLTSTQTITGTKTFTSVLNLNNYLFSTAATILISKNNNYTIGTTPTSSTASIIAFQDSSGVNTAYIQQLSHTDTWNHLYLSAKNKKSDNSIVSALLDLRAKADGTAEISGVTPIDATDNSTKLATTAWKQNNDNTVRTNCITAIPQDLNFELNDGTLTLKAGSKVYVPNGSGTFDVVITQNDISVYGVGSASSDSVYVYYYNNSLRYTTATRSGSVDDTSAGLFYNTTENIIKRYTTVLEYSGTSFPICVLTMTLGVFTSINQVFNGFGYIGSTLFALPGIKGLIPNGRNSDGTLNSNSFTTTSVMTYSINSDWGTGKEQFFINASNLNLHRGIASYFICDTKPTVTASASYWYSPLENILRSTSDTGATWSQIYGAEAIKISFSSGKIDSMYSKTAFRVLDYNDRGIIAGLPMPSSRYNNLTLGASGTAYTAPANGWYYLNKVAGSDWYYIKLSVSRNNVELYNDYDADYRTTPLTILLPVLKDDVVTIAYNATGTTNYFRFFYAEGEI